MNGTVRMPESEPSVFHELLAVIDHYRTSSDVRTTSGAQLICKLPWVSEYGWLHRVYAPCTDDALSTLVPATRRYPPQALIDFLREANGASLFYGSLSVFGVRGNWIRDAENALTQPFDIASHNADWADLFGSEDFLVGACGPDVDVCVWRTTSDHIDRISQAEGRVLESWPSFRIWLIEEAKRLSECHSPDGRLLTPQPIQPGKARPWPQELPEVGRAKPLTAVWWSKVEERLGLPSDSLPTGWWRNFGSRALRRLLNRRKIDD